MLKILGHLEDLLSTKGDALWKGVALCSRSEEPCLETESDMELAGWLPSEEVGTFGGTPASSILLMFRKKTLWVETWPLTKQ